MNKINGLVFAVFATMLFTGCAGEEDNIFSQSAAERLNAASGLYSSRLAAHDAGWALQLYPNNTEEGTIFESGYLLLCDFNKDKTVKVGMNNTFTDNIYKEDISLWDIITDNGPVLSFSTYNKCLHAFSSPEDLPQTTGTSENEQGKGMEGDYEFVIVDAPEDGSYIMLKGKKRGTYNLMTPLEDGTDFQDYLADLKSFVAERFTEDSPNSISLLMSDNLYEVNEMWTGLPNIVLDGKDAILNGVKTPYIITKRNGNYYMRFRNPLTNESQSVSEQEFVYDAEKDIFVSENNDNCYFYGGEPKAILTDILTNTTRQWTWDSKSDMSESYKELYDNLTEAFKKDKITLVSLSLQSVNNRLVLRLKYKVKQTTNIDYLFELKESGDYVTFDYLGPDKDNGALVLEKYPDMQNIINMLTTQLRCEAAVSRFNINALKFTSVTNPDLWFVAKLSQVTKK